MAAVILPSGSSLEASGTIDHWHAGDASPSATSCGSLVLIVTNFSLPACTPALWHAASLRLVADGGANRLFDELPLLTGTDTTPEQVRSRNWRRRAWSPLRVEVACSGARPDKTLTVFLSPVARRGPPTCRTS